MDEADAGSLAKGVPVPNRTGHYQLESQRLAAQQSAPHRSAAVPVVENTAQYETSRIAAQALAKNAAEYFTELSYLATLSKTPKDIRDLDERMRGLWRSAFELSLQTTIPAAQKILEANVYVAELLAAGGDPEKLKALEQRGKVLGEAYVSLYSDVARYRFTSGPTTGRDELLTSVLQLLAQTSSGPK